MCTHTHLLTPHNSPIAITPSLPLPSTHPPTLIPSHPNQFLTPTQVGKSQKGTLALQPDTILEAKGSFVTLLSADRDLKKGILLDIVDKVERDAWIEALFAHINYSKTIQSQKVAK